MAKSKVKTRRVYVTKAKRHKNHRTISVAVVGGTVPLALQAVKGWKEGGVEGVGKRLSAFTTGYVPDTGEWSGRYLIQGVGPIALGGVIHKYVGGSLGINKMIARAGVPLLRI